MQPPYAFAAGLVILATFPIWLKLAQLGVFPSIILGHFSFTVRPLCNFEEIIVVDGLQTLDFSTYRDFGISAILDYQIESLDVLCTAFFFFFFFSNSSSGGGDIDILGGSKILPTISEIPNWTETFTSRHRLFEPPTQS
jgi:hypothetical protein